MPSRTADAEWTGTLREGNGRMRFGSGAFDGAYTWSSRFEEAPGTNPEELIAAAHAGCFSMALSGNVVKAGFAPERIETSATVTLERGEAGSSITRIELATRATIPEIDNATFQGLAEQTKQTCPVSRALAAVPEVTVTAELVS